MASNNIGDKIIWTAVIASGVAAYWFLPYYLKHVKNLAAVSAPKWKPTTPQVQQDDAEASIKPETLAVLASGPNHNLAASAIRLTAARFVKDPRAKKDLLRDLSSKEWHRRDRAINGLRVLLSAPALRDSGMRQHFLDQATYSSFIAALVNVLPEHQQNSTFSDKPTSPIKPPNRPAHELSLMQLLLILLDEPRSYGTNSFYIVDVQPAINAGIVTKWLQFYPFPCALSQNRRFNFVKSDVCQLLEPKIWGADDELMSNIVQLLMKLPSGARQLADVGLRAASVHHRTHIGSREWATRSHPALAFEDVNPWSVQGSDEEDTDDDQLEDAGQLIAESDLLGRLQHTQRRSRDERTPGERSRQRRHRQAIVVAEAGAPLRPENILQRQPTETEISWQHDIHDRQG